MLSDCYKQAPSATYTPPLTRVLLVKAYAHIFPSLARSNILTSGSAPIYVTTTLFSFTASDEVRKPRGNRVCAFFPSNLKQHFFGCVFVGAALVLLFGTTTPEGTREGRKKGDKRWGALVGSKEKTYWQGYQYFAEPTTGQRLEEARSHGCV